ncbi:MAG: LPS-assembly protein LptD, partial [Acidobacteria bacterium]|nr:LPS-assembly protein LptD [Acidobacteriota bacterium]
MARSVRLWVTAVVILLAAAQAAAQMGAIAVRAKGTQEFEGDVWRASEDVVITYQDIRIQCQSVELNRVTGDIKAEGDVILDRGPQRFTADRLLYNLKTKSGTFLNATGTAPPSYSFTGAVLERVDETHYRIIDGTFTACEQDRPAWDLHLREALIEDEGYGRFKGVAFRIKRLPVLYFPYLLWPVKTERAAGLMMPGFGYSERRGFYLGTRVFVPLGRSYDTTINIDWFSEKYYGLGTEFRWAPTQGAYGEIYAYTVRDPNDGVWQWKIDGRHQQEDVLGFRLTAEIHELSDNDFFQEFENDVQQNTRRYL